MVIPSIIQTKFCTKWPCKRIFVWLKQPKLPLPAPPPAKKLLGLWAKLFSCIYKFPILWWFANLVYWNPFLSWFHPPNLIGSHLNVQHFIIKTDPFVHSTLPNYLQPQSFPNLQRKTVIGNGRTLYGRVCSQERTNYH